MSRPIIKTRIKVPLALFLFSFLMQPALAQEAPRILTVLVPAGWDTTLVFDSKVGSTFIDQEIGATETFGKGNIRYVHHANRPSVKSFFDNYGDRTLIINGIFTGGMTHELSLKNTLGSHHSKNKKYSYYLSLYAYGIGQTLMPHLLLDLPVLSEENQEISVGLRSDLIQEIKTGGALTPSQEPIAETTLDSYLLNSFSEDLKGLTLGSESYRQVFTGYLNSARQTGIRNTVDLYWSTDGSLSLLTKKLLFAERLLANSLASTVTVGADFDGQDWDSYTNSKTYQSQYFESLFASLNILMNAMANDPAHANTLLIVTSNLGRAPTTEENGRRGHWPYTSAMLLGPGIKKGQTLGATDEVLRGKLINPLFGDFTSAEVEPLTFKHIFSALFMQFSIPHEDFVGKIHPFSYMLEQL